MPAQEYIFDRINTEFIFLTMGKVRVTLALIGLAQAATRTALETDIRLVNGPTVQEGRLEVKLRNLNFIRQKFSISVSPSFLNQIDHYKSFQCNRKFRIKTQFVDRFFRR